MMYLDGEPLSSDMVNAYDNRAFLYGDAVKVFFFFKDRKLVMAEEVYFYLMSSMRKMRMNIPLSFTLEFFSNQLTKAIENSGFASGRIPLLVFRRNASSFSAKTPVHYLYSVEEDEGWGQIRRESTIDIIKEISVNTNMLSNIYTHSPENCYATIYAQDNDLDELILLNPNKRIARSIYGNILFLEGEEIKLPKQSEGAYISPLMEHFVTYVHKNNLAQITPTEMIAFESQKADEVLIISEEKGLSAVGKIRNKNFSSKRFHQMVSGWWATL